MRVLYICSSDNGKPKTVVKNQLASLQKNGIEAHYYLIRKKGVTGYLYHMWHFRRYLKKNNNYDVIHAHYSLCGFVAALTGASPLVVSLMGSDGQRKILRPVLKLFNHFFWDHVIVKSEDLKQKASLQCQLSVIPNGVELGKFPEIEQDEACRLVGFNPEKHNILFLADPEREEKNVDRAKEAMDALGDDNARLKTVHDIPHKMINTYLQAADVLILTSDYEGSPNVIKEALAANCKIVSTPVGDVETLLDGVEGTYVASFEPTDIADKIKEAIQFEGKPNGIKKVQELKLDAKQIAERIINLYREIL